MSILFAVLLYASTIEDVRNCKVLMEDILISMDRPRVLQRDTVLDINSLNQFPKAQFGNGATFRTLKGQGKVHEYTQIVNDGAQFKFIKYVKNDPERVLDELRWSRVLSDLGVAPKFHGVVKDKEGNIGIVTDHVMGKHFDTDGIIPKGNSVSKQTLTRLKEIREQLARSQIIPYDFQFRVDRNGRPWIVDVEGYGTWDELIEINRNSVNPQAVIDPKTYNGEIDVWIKRITRHLENKP